MKTSGMISIGKDPRSKGHICPKAIALQDIQRDPDRLRRPMNRGQDGFEEISWDEAFSLVEEKLGPIRKKYGNNAIALYLGNPTVHNSDALLLQIDRIMITHYRHH